MMGLKIKNKETIFMRRIMILIWVKMVRNRDKNKKKKMMNNKIIMLSMMMMIAG